MSCVSCATYKTPFLAYAPDKNHEYYNIRKKALEHPLYNYIPRHREQIKSLDFFHWATWTFLGNEDDGIFGESRKRPYSTNINLRTFASWQMRNPGHNFCFYVIGSADWKEHCNFSILDLNDKNSRILESSENSEVFSGNNGLKLAFNDFKPFIAFNFRHLNNKEFQFYFGWRNEGNFGIKLRPVAKKKR